MESLFSTQWFRPYVLPFLFLQYPTETPKHTDSFHDSPYYSTGVLDVCLMITLIAIMAILRDIFRLWVFEPFARWKLLRDLKYERKQEFMLTAKTNGHANGKANGYRNGSVNGNGVTKSQTPFNGNLPLALTPKQERILRRSIMRFAEQGWSAIYYPLQWGFGLYVHRHLPTRVLDPIDVWREYPHFPLAGPLKFYYISQIAFYLHQVLILNAEARRKDHVQMMTHHVITVALMALSYFYNLTRAGCLIMVLMDWCDIFLPIAKMMRYLNMNQLFSDCTFGVFLVSWLITRHGLFMISIISCINDAPTVIRLRWHPETGHYFSPLVHALSTGLLICLQFIQMIWFWMICRVAWRVISTGKGASDDRSDDEGDDDDRKD